MGIDTYALVPLGSPAPQGRAAASTPPFEEIAFADAWGAPFGGESSASGSAGRAGGATSAVGPASGPGRRRPPMPRRRLARRLPEDRRAAAPLPSARQRPQPRPATPGWLLPHHDAVPYVERQRPARPSESAPNACQPCWTRSGPCEAAPGRSRRPIRPRQVERRDVEGQARVDVLIEHLEDVAEAGDGGAGLARRERTCHAVRGPGADPG